MKNKPKNKNVIYLGLLSLFGGISLDLVAPIIPTFITTVLGFDKTFLGLTEGLATSSSSLFKIVSGILTDKYKKRKPIIFVGYLLSMLSRIFLAFVSATPLIVLMRTLDGTGRGIKDAPKDTLIADSSGANERGKQFGIVRALDTLGSVAGPIMLFGLLAVLTNNTNKFHLIFLVSALPLVITLLLIVFKIKETGKEVQASIQTSGPLPAKFYLFMVLLAVFGLGNASEAFLLLKAQDTGVSILALPLVYALLNFVYALAAIPLGSLSDRIGRKKILMLGWAIFSFSYLGFAFVQNSLLLLLLFVLYGIYYAATFGVIKALISDLVAVNQRGRAYGIYNALLSVIALPAGLIAGGLWDRFGSTYTFGFGAVMCLITLILFALFSFRPVGKVA